jgi:hypothetical protein
MKDNKTTWTEGSFEKGPFKGKFWGVLLGSEFFMIVPRKDKKGAFFEVWRDGVVHDETRNATLAKAQAFAATLASGTKKAA